MEYGRERIKRPWWAFILVYVLFLVFNASNGAGAWCCIFSGLGLTNTWLESALTLDAFGRTWYHASSTLTHVLYSFSGFVFSLFPALAFFFMIKEKKNPAIVFSALFVAFSLVQVIAFCGNFVYALCWALECALAVCMLLYAILGKGRKVFLYFALGLVGLGVVAYALLMCTRVDGSFSRLRLKWSAAANFNNPQRAFRFAHSGRFALKISSSVATAFYPLSRVLLLAFCAVGFMMCNKKTVAVEPGYGKPKKLKTAILLSVFFGRYGVDRFYLGYVISGILKLLTFGGLGIWTLIDVIRISTSSLRPRNGLPWYDKNKPYIPPQPAAPLSPPEEASQTSPPETL